MKTFKRVVFLFILVIPLIIQMNSFAVADTKEAEKIWEFGETAYEKGNYEEALTYYNKSLVMYRGLNHQEGVSANLNSIGLVYWSLGQHEKAILYYEEALQIDKRRNVPKDIATTLNNIGEAYSSLGQYEKAMSYQDEALRIRRRINVPEDIAESLNNIGLVYWSLGQNGKALQYYEESLKILRERNMEKYIAMSLNNIGEVYKSLGLYEKAILSFKESLHIKQKSDNLQDAAITIDNLGGVYSLTGQYKKAIFYHEEAIKIRKKYELSEDLGLSLLNVGVIYSEIGQHKKALAYYKESLNIFRKLNNSRYMAAILDNIGYTYLAQKMYKEAENNFIESDKEQKKTGIELRGNLSLAELYVATKRFDDALSILKNGVPTWVDTDLYRIQFHTLQGLSFKNTMMLRKASSELLKAVTTSEDIRQRLKEREGFLGAGLYGGHIRAYRELVAVLSEISLKGEKMDEGLMPYGMDPASSAFYFSELIKARALLEAIATSGKKYNKSEIPTSIKQKEEDILAQLSLIETQWSEIHKKGESAFLKLKNKKKELQKELDNLVSVLRKDYPLYASLNYPKPISNKELQLKDNQVLVEYAITGDASYVFVVRKGKVQKLVKIPLSKDVIEAKVKKFIEPFNTNQISGVSLSLAKEMYDILLSDALKDVKETEKIIIVPDGILGLLPFEALVIKQGNDFKDSVYVTDRFAVTYSQSATALSLINILKHSEAKKPLFALGNPVYDKSDPRYIAYKQGQLQKPLLAQNLNQYAFRGITVLPKSGSGNEWEEVVYMPLPETETEVRTIAKLFNIQPVPPDVLLNVSASETNFRSIDLRSYRYIHFATHADLPGKVQGITEPFIILGQVENKDKNDGFLTLSEVLGLGLDADMVVLSACSTGKGEMIEGEGVSNFARAFQHAGSRSVVVSLWEVASKETVEYMESFYKHLKAGQSKTEALRLARKEIKAKYPNPFYWAVFILHGE